MPIDAGGRLTGKVGAFGVGVMNIQAGDEAVSATPATNFTVLRVKRDILRRSTIGAMFTNRNKSSRDGGRQQPGLRRRRGARLLPERRDRRVLRAHRDDRRRSATTRATRASSTGRRIATASAPRCSKVGKAFNPEVGFLRRTDFTRSFASARFSPRPKSSRLRSQVHLAGELRVLRERRRRRSSRARRPAAFNIEFNNSDVVQRRSERQLRPAADAVFAGARACRFRSAAITTTTC